MLRSVAAAEEVLRALVLRSPLKDIINALGSSADVYLVGGTVRDTLLQRPVADYDLACSLSAAESAQRLRNCSIRTVDTGLQHGTIMAVCAGHSLEITALRTAAGETSMASIETDMRARDFTINSVVYSVAAGKILDPLGGIADLQNGLLRAVPPAELRFTEDPLRILRLVRFGPAQGRKLDTQSDQAARKHAALLANIAPERIRAEFEKILLSEHAGPALRYMLSAGLWPYCLPEMSQAAGFEQNRYHIHDVFEHTVSVVERCRPDLRLRLAALFHDLGKPASLSVAEDGERHFYQHEKISEQICRKRMRALRFSNSETDAVCTLVRLHMRPLDCGPSGLRRLMRDLGEHFRTWRDFKLADASPATPAEETSRALQAFDAMVAAENARIEKLQAGNALAVRGEDLLAIGFQPGPRMGAVIKALQELVIDEPELNRREILLERARALLSSGNL